MTLVANHTGLVAVQTTIAKEIHDFVIKVTMIACSMGTPYYYTMKCSTLKRVMWYLEEGEAAF